MGESLKFLKSLAFEIPILKVVVRPLNFQSIKFKWSIVFRQTKYNSANLS